MRKILWVGALLSIFSGCARQPLSPEKQKQIDQVSSASFLGDEFVLDVSNHGLLGGGDRVLDVTAWHMDESFRDMLKERAESYGKEFRAFRLDPEKVEKALGARESRYKRVVGKRNQALMELLFTSAEREGIRFFFLLQPSMAPPERFLLHKGSYGVFCNDRGKKDARASVYFSFDFTIWDVAKRKAVFEYTVDPSVTEAMTFGDCRIVADASDPAKQLEDPVKKTMSLLMDALFEKMGWRKP